MARRPIEIRTLARIFFKKLTQRLPWLGGLGWRLEAVLLKLFWYWVRRMPPAAAATAGYRIFHRFGHRLKKSRYVIPNLKIAFPEMTGEQLRQTSRATWGNFGAVLAEYPHLHEIAVNGPSPAVEVVMAEPARPVIENKTPAVYITAHLANWELAASTIAGLGVPLSVVYAPQSNPLLDRMIQTQRQPLGCRFITKNNAVRQLVREMRAGRSVGLLPDQRINSGEPVPYFGFDALTTTAPAWLAIKMQCPLIPLQIERIGPARFRVVFHEPLDTRADVQDSHARLLAITKQINACFEAWIRRDPQHWLCVKRRWPRAAYQAVRRDPT